MLRSQVKLCEVTKRRMPVSFMVRFVNATDSVHSKVAAPSTQKLNYVPNLTSTNKLHQYLYVHASNEILKKCEGSK